MQELDDRLSQVAAHDPTESSLFETLVRMEHDLSDVIGGLALLGVKRCSQCRQFFGTADPGALFDYGKLVCYACIPEWWHSLSSQIGIAEREQIEAKLSPWLRKYHRAEVVRNGPGAPEPQEFQFQLTTSCLECRGSGKLLEGERCRFCSGLGTVRLVVPR